MTAAFLDAVLLVRLAPRWSALLGSLRHPYHWVERIGVDGAAAAVALTLLWLAACWLGLGLLLAAISVVPGGVGRAAGALSRRVQPGLLQKIVLTAAGASLVWSPIGASAASPAAPPNTSIVVTLPTDTASAAPDQPSGSPLAPTPTLPAGAVPATPSPTSSTAAHVRSPSASPSQAGATAATAAAASPPSGASDSLSRPTPGARADTRRVGVRPGDSLWQITADQLGPSATPAAVAESWPRLYAANRQVIGGDPGLVRPGQTLTVPAGIGPAANSPTANGVRG